jgi:hypothetical protein
MEINETYIFSLPQEAHIHILSFLSAKDLCVMSAVSYLFKTLAGDDILWKPIAKELNATLITDKCAKECVKIKIQAYPEMNLILRKYFFRIPRVSKDQFKENCRYLANQRWGTNNLKVIVESGKSSNTNRTIIPGNLELVKVLCFHGVKPNIHILRTATKTFKLEIVKFFMENHKQEFEKEIKQTEENLQKAKHPDDQKQCKGSLNSQKTALKEAQELIDGGKAYIEKKRLKRNSDFLRK